tara:strand:+ start:21399 stop:21632 length:234 start_codon:yes stop_codon:yes gene_type:complete
MSDTYIAHREIALNLADRAQLPVVSTLALTFASMVVRWSDRSKQRRTLAGLSDQHLDDIGLSRTRATAEADKRFWQQ